MKRADRAPRAAFHHAKWHDWYVCRSCGCLVEDWELHHPCPVAELAELRGTLTPTGAGGYGLEEAAELGRAEGAADTAEAATVGMWRGGWRQVAAMLAADWAWLRGLRPPAPAGPVPAAARGEAWARIDALIERTTRP